MLIERFTDDLDQYIRARFGYKSPSATVSPFGKTVIVNEENVDLYLRFPPAAEWPKDCLVIARIGFEAQRAGHGTHLLAFLIQISEKYEFAAIGVESTHDRENIQNFLHKYGFALFKGSNNWIASVKALSERLRAG